MYLPIAWNISVHGNTVECVTIDKKSVGTIYQMCDHSKTVGYLQCGFNAALDIVNIFPYVINIYCTNCLKRGCLSPIFQQISNRSFVFYIKNLNKLLHVVEPFILRSKMLPLSSLPVTNSFIFS